VDVVYDDHRRAVYATTDDGYLHIYDVVTRTFTDATELGGNLMTVDISPDRTQLLIADRSKAGANVWLHIYDIESGEEHHLNLPAEDGESGTYSAVYIDDSHALESGTFSGSGWTPLRLVDLSDGSSEKLDDVRQDTSLTLSADGSVVAFAESNSSGGPYGLYVVADGTLKRAEADSFLYAVGVSADGSMLALPTYQGLQVLDAQFQGIGVVLDPNNRNVLEAQFSPVANILYVAWTDSSASKLKGSIDAYDSRTLKRTGSVAADLNFPWNGNSGLGPGRFKTSADGTLLVAVATDGITVVELP
jgi:dipeptidyl aminopeptidase/acylaminoacyl peptidase